MNPDDHWLPEQLEILRNPQTSVEEKCQKMMSWGYVGKDVKNALERHEWKSKTRKKKWRNDGGVYRSIVEEHIGRELKPDETIHHINRDHKDNRLGNLFICPWGEHICFHNGTLEPPIESNLSQFVNSRVAKIRKP